MAGDIVRAWKYVPQCCGSLVCHPFQALQPVGKFGGLICLHIAIDQFTDFSRVRRSELAGSHGREHGRDDSRGILSAIDCLAR